MVAQQAHHELGVAWLQGAMRRLLQALAVHYGAQCIAECSAHVTHLVYGRARKARNFSASVRAAPRPHLPLTGHRSLYNYIYTANRPAPSVSSRHAGSPGMRTSYSAA